MPFLLTVTKTEGGHSQSTRTEVVGLYETLKTLLFYIKNSRIPIDDYKVYEVVAQKKLEIAIVD